MTSLRRIRWTTLAIVAGLILRLYFVLSHSLIEGDSLMYGDIASNLLRHHIYGISVGNGVQPTLMRVPGYPILLAACFAIFGAGHFAAVLYVQIVIDLATWCLIAALARRLMGKRAGLCALWLGMLCPFTANFVATPLTETCSLLCAAIAFYSLERWSAVGGLRMRWVWPMIFALAFGIFLRPDRALVAAAVIPAMGWRASRESGEQRIRSLSQVVLVCVGIALPMLLWGVRNWRVFHVVQPLAPRSATDPGQFVSYGFNRWYRTWGVEFKSTYDVYWNYDSAPLSIDDLPPRAFDSDAQRQQTLDVLTAYNRFDTATPALDASFATLAAQRVAAHPIRYYLELPVLRLLDMWLRPRIDMLPMPLDWWRFRAHPLASVLATLFAALNLAFLWLAAAGLWIWRRKGWSGRRPLGYALIAFVVMRSALLLTMDNSEPRYTIDCYPVVILLASFALTQFIRKGRPA